MLDFFPRGVLDEILNLIESVSEGFPSYSYTEKKIMTGNSDNYKEKLSLQKKPVPTKRRNHDRELR